MDSAYFKKHTYGTTYKQNYYNYIQFLQHCRKDFKKLKT